MKTIRTARCVLEPQVEGHASAMFDVLSDPAIYEFEGVAPPSVEKLAAGYRRKETRLSPDGREKWLNWVVRLPSNELAGYVQATVLESGSSLVGYEFASKYWRQGIGSASVSAVLDELARSYAVHTVVAVLKKANYRSMGLLHRLGFKLGTEEDALTYEAGQDETVLMVHVVPRVGTTQVSPAQELTLYGAAASGSVAVEAALTLLNMPFKVVEGATWACEAARQRVGGQNAMRQIPTLVLPGGEVLTESAGILIYLADLHPETKLSPGPAEPARRQFLRWMFFVSSAIYSLHWIKPDVSRIGAPPSARDDVVQAVHERIAFCWRTMDAQINPAKYLLGDDLSVLDLYVAVVSRFGPWRDRFYAEAPRMTPAIRRVDDDPRLSALWESRFPRG